MTSHEEYARYSSYIASAEQRRESWRAARPHLMKFLLQLLGLAIVLVLVSII